MKSILYILSLCSIIFLNFSGASARVYSPLPPELDGTMMPYDFSSVVKMSVPDSLTPFHIEYIARHGARYISSQSKILKLKERLVKANKEDLLTNHGRDFLSFILSIEKASEGKWGALSQVGEKEEVELARFFSAEGHNIIENGKINAISSLIPRVVATMYTFNATLNILQPGIDIYSLSGPVTSPLLRFFDTDKTYYDWLHPDSIAANKADSWVESLRNFEETTLPVGPSSRLFKNALPKEELQKISAQMYGVLQSLRATALGIPTTQWFTPGEYRACWECSNAGHYLKRSLNSLTTIPMQAVAPLMINIINNVDLAAISQNSTSYNANLMFGHAETLLPLAALMNLPGASALPLDLNQLSSVWKDYEITPLGANIFMTFARHKQTGMIYARVSLNGKEAKWESWHDIRAEWLERIAAFSLRDE